MYVYGAQRKRRTVAWRCQVHFPVASFTMPARSGARYGSILYFSYHVHRDLLSGKQMSEPHGLLDVCIRNE